MALRAHNRVNSHLNKKLSRSQSLSSQIRRYPTLDRKLDSISLEYPVFVSRVKDLKEKKEKMNPTQPKSYFTPEQDIDEFIEEKARKLDSNYSSSKSNLSTPTKPHRSRTKSKPKPQTMPKSAKEFIELYEPVACLTPQSRRRMNVNIKKAFTLNGNMNDDIGRRKSFLNSPYLLNSARSSLSVSSVDTPLTSRTSLISPSSTRKHTKSTFNFDNIKKDDDDEKLEHIETDVDVMVKKYVETPLYDKIAIKRDDFNLNSEAIWTRSDEVAYCHYKYNHKIDTQKGEHYVMSLFLNSSEFLDLHHKEITEIRKKIDEKKFIKEKDIENNMNNKRDINIKVIEDGYGIRLHEEVRRRKSLIENDINDLIYMPAGLYPNCATDKNRERILSGKERDLALNKVSGEIMDRYKNRIDAFIKARKDYKSRLILEETRKRDKINERLRQRRLLEERKTDFYYKVEKMRKYLQNLEYRKMIRSKMQKDNKNYTYSVKLNTIPKTYQKTFDKFENSMKYFNKDDMQNNRNVNSRRIMERSRNYINNIKNGYGGGNKKVKESKMTRNNKIVVIQNALRSYICRLYTRALSYLYDTSHIIRILETYDDKKDGYLDEIGLVSFCQLCKFNDKVTSDNLILLYNDKKHIEDLNINPINTTNGKPVIFVKITDVINWYIRNKPRFSGLNIIEMMKIVNIARNIKSREVLILNDMKKDNDDENGDNNDNDKENNENKESEENKNRNRNRILLLSDDPRILLREECNQFVRSRKESNKDYYKNKSDLDKLKESLPEKERDILTKGLTEENIVKHPKVQSVEIHRNVINCLKSATNELDRLSNKLNEIEIEKLEKKKKYVNSMRDEPSPKPVEKKKDKIKHEKVIQPLLTTSYGWPADRDDCSLYHYPKENIPIVKKPDMPVYSEKPAIRPLKKKKKNLSDDSTVSIKKMSILEEQTRVKNNVEFISQNEKYNYKEIKEIKERINKENECENLIDRIWENPDEFLKTQKKIESK